MSYAPIIVVVLALIAAVSIGVVAWHLSDDEFHKSFESDSVERKNDDSRPADR